MLNRSSFLLFYHTRQSLLSRYSASSNTKASKAMSVLKLTPAPVLRPRSETIAATLPLTTIFTPPQSCLDAPFTLAGNTSRMSFAWRDESETSSGCYPKSFSSLQWEWGWYSPGVCPSAWSIGASRTISSGNQPLTQAWCCPSGMYVQQFLSDNGSTYQYCTSTANNTDIIDTGDGLTKTTSTTSTFLAIQYPMSVEWVSSDVTRYSAAFAPMLAGSATSIASSASSGAHVLSNVDTVPIEHDPLLTTADKAGIGAGVAVGALLIIAAIVFWISRRCKGRKQQRLPGSPPDQYQSSNDEEYELPNYAAEKRLPDGPPELDSRAPPRHEMDDTSKPAPGCQSWGQEPVELNSNWHGNEMFSSRQEKP